MTRFFTVALVVALTFAVAAPAFAQFDTGGPNADLAAQGLDPSTRPNNNVNVTLPGNFVVEIFTGANANTPLILLASSIEPEANAPFPTPWGGSLDIGGPIVGGVPSGLILVGDGFGYSNGSAPSPLNAFYFSDDGNALLGQPPTFLFAQAAGTQLAGFNLSMQGIVVDPSNPPFNFDNTQPVSLNFFIGQDLNLLTGDDGEVNVPFTVGTSFNFHGANYTDIFVSGNGYVTFGATSSVAGFGGDNTLWAAAEPGIALIQADWNPSGFNPAAQVRFNQIGNDLEITYGDTSIGAGLQHFASSDTNRMSLNMQLDDGMGGNPNEGQFTIRHELLDQSGPGTYNDYGVGFFGHTPGTTVAGGAVLNPASVVDTDLNLVSVGGPGDAQLEEHDFDMLNANNFGYDGLGTLRGYNNITTNRNGRTTQFVPNAPLLVTGDSGYVSIPDGTQQPADLNPMGGVIDPTAANLVTLTGSFSLLPDALGTFPAGTVTIDDGVTTIDVTGGIVGIYDNGSGQLPAGTPTIGGLSGPGTLHRDTQALDINIGPLAGFATSGTYTITMTFSDATVKTATGQLQAIVPGITTTTYSNSGIGLALGDDASVNHVFQPGQTVTFYGTAYTGMFVCSNGMIGFTAGSGDFTPTLGEFFDGFTAAGDLVPGTPGVAARQNDYFRFNDGATIVVSEDSINAWVDVNYNNMVEWNTMAPVGNWSLRLDAIGPDSVEFNYAGAVPGSDPTYNHFMGVTDGNDQVGSNTDMAVTGGLGFENNAGYQSTLAGATLPDSVAEGKLSSFNFADPTGLGDWTNAGFSNAGGPQFLILPGGDILIL